ncbi:MAG: proline--tRNA ligase [Actinomycetota bacterium]|nr:proline--tRNA ligase [Actinomycetota bacterium]MDG2119959.1 proline--tRNA ligase [Actinomycetota bacterium]
MRWSQSFIPTLRDAPADAEAVSHKLLVRGGYIRQLHSGHYSLLPLGLRVHNKVANIVRKEMDAIGGQEFLLPAMHPATIWQQSGRWDVMGDEMFRLQDRSGVDLALGMTHEEIFSTLGTEVKSYKELPQTWYQIQTKFRDEPRAKSGLLRVREFAMKDSYSFDLDQEGLDKSFTLHHDAYVKIFSQLGIMALPVQASSGSMGGSSSIEFMVPSPAGEDDVIRCLSCDYRANVERGTSALEASDDKPGPDLPFRIATPGIRTISGLAEMHEEAPASRQIKTLVVVIDDVVSLVLLRGDHQLNNQKLQDSVSAMNIRPANPEEIVATLGASPGSLGAVGVLDLPIYADHGLHGRTNMTTGSNENDWHLGGVDISRDIHVSAWHDLREVTAGERCIECNAELEIIRCIEAGHIFKLGQKYSQAMGISVLDENGRAVAPVMGSYGIGIGRAVAAIAENCHDEKGLIWPLSVAPFAVVITLLNIDQPDAIAVTDVLYEGLTHAGVEVILDDRKARPGVKFADAELLGIPIRVTVGSKGLLNGTVEITLRKSNETSEINVDEALPHLLNHIATY